jgi:hypothetical protein
MMMQRRLGQLANVFVDDGADTSMDTVVRRFWSMTGAPRASARTIGPRSSSAVARVVDMKAWAAARARGLTPER